MAVPPRTFFVLGPRGTGKTTWLRQRLPGARWYNLLLDREVVRLTRDPHAFRRELEALPHDEWVVIDEVQRLPALLNEVHDALTASQGKRRFALTGSSARKLRRGDVNLLAGRALNRRFFPLVAAEMGSLPVEDVLRYGCLPEVRSEADPSLQAELLSAYRDTYLAQEIRNEALVRSLDGFSRFLEVVALANGQVVNMSSIARDAAIARPTVQGYFEVLVDTLVADWLPAFRPRARIKEVAHPKLYLFDTGVARALAGREREPLDGAERGHLLETYVHHELRAAMHHSGAGGELAYWATPSGTEVDFVWSRGDKRTALEVKATARYRPEDARALKELALALKPKPKRLVLIYLGERRLKDENVDVLPLGDLIDQLNDGELTP
jgi:predicted AAA+ superfamily ATPase